MIILISRQSRRTRTCAKTNLLTIVGAFKFRSQPPRAVARGEKKEEMKKKRCVFYAKSSFPDARIIVDPVMRVFILSFAALCMNKSSQHPIEHTLSFGF